MVAVAIFWHSSAQALQASPQSLHSVILGNLSHSFLQSLQIISTVLARWPVCSELTAASVGAGGNKLKSRVGAGSHARVLHGEHAVAMPEAIIACHDTFRRGVLKGLVFRRMHFLHPANGLGDLFNDTFLRSSCFPFDTLLRSSCCSFADRHLLDRSNVRIILRKSL